MSISDFLATTDQSKLEATSNTTSGDVQPEDVGVDADNDFLTNNAPSLLGPAAPSAQLGDMDEIPGRKSTVRNNELRSTLAGLSFRGKRQTRALLHEKKHF